MSKLIFLDVDGTLVDYHNRIPESAIKAIRQAREKGHLVYVCTGRSKAEMQPELWEIGLDGMIGGNGSYVEHHGQVLMHQLISKEDAALSKKEYKEKLKNYKYPSVSYEIADQIEKRSGTEVRVTVPGHTQRGGSPCPYDRALCTRLGAAAARAIIDEDYGYMIAMVNDKTKRVPLKDVAGKLKTVDPDCQMIKEAKTIGISFGD